MSDIPSDGAILERAKDMGSNACYAIKLQHRRIQTSEPEDKDFIFRKWIDCEFLVVAFYRLKRAAVLASRVPSVRDNMEAAINAFNHALPGLAKMRNVAEHFDEYALDDHEAVNKKRLRHKDVSRRQLQVSSWDGKTFYWLGNKLNIDDASHAAYALFCAIKKSLEIYEEDTLHSTAPTAGH